LPLTDSQLANRRIALLNLGDFVAVRESATGATYGVIDNRSENLQH
jgi:hypothetical protein